FFTGGAEPAAQSAATAAADTAAEAAVQTIGSRIANQFLTKAGGKEIYNFVKQFGADTIKQGGLIAGATFLAKFIVLSYAGTQVNGASTGKPFTDQADSGMN